MTTPADKFNVTATLDKPAGYTTGDTITITIAGDAVQTSTETDQVTLTITAADGSTTTIGPIAVPLTKVAAESVKVTAASSALGLKYTPAASGLSVTATAP